MRDLAPTTFLSPRDLSYFLAPFSPRSQVGENAGGTRREHGGNEQTETSLES